MKDSLLPSFDRGSGRRVLLVNMPWASLDRPALSLACLTDAIERGSLDIEVHTLNANILWADWLLELDPPVLPRQFDEYGLDNYFLGFGDWVFTSALYGREWMVDEFAAHAASASKDAEPPILLHRSASAWVQQLADAIVALQPGVVGLTTTFQQTIASLALARALKERDPRIITVMGGANCDGDQGAAVHRNFPEIDFVVRGEGETAFPQLLSEVGLAEGDFSLISGLCWRSASGASLANEMAKDTVDLSKVAAPRYDEYFDLLQASGLEEYVTARLVLESSRGCWWGQKHHCTFCGLNGTYMTYRSKPQEQFFNEIVETVRRYKILDIYIVDNILDMKYFQRLLPMLAESDWDLHVQYEIKSSLRRHQLKALLDAGAQSVQPGIESLDSRVLSLMDKGVTGPQNVRLLRDAKSVGVDIHWNYLYGFPGETEGDYTDVLRQLPSLFHLQPPRVASPIAVERFSPYFSKPELGFTEIAPAYYYHLLFDLPIEEIFDLAYLFDAERQGIIGDVELELQALTDRWRKEFYSSRFIERERPGKILLSSRRSGIPWNEREISSESEIALYCTMREPSTMEQLLGAVPIGEAQLSETLDSWVKDGIIFHNSAKYVTLATDDTGIEVVSSPRTAFGLQPHHADSEEGLDAVALA